MLTHPALNGAGWQQSGRAMNRRVPSSLARWSGASRRVLGFPLDCGSGKSREICSVGEILRVSDSKRVALERGSARPLATYPQALLACPEGCTRGESLFDPGTGKLIVQLAPLDPERVSPKERPLIDLFAQGRPAGRRVLVYAAHTGTRDIIGAPGVAAHAARVQDGRDEGRPGRAQRARGLGPGVG